MKLHYAYYGDTKLIRGYCEDCKRTALIIKNRFQCCDTLIKPSTIEDHRIMVSPEGERKSLKTAKRRQQLKAQKNKCFYCGKLFGSIIHKGTSVSSLKIEWDHVNPFSYSLSNNDNNFVAACNICNQWKYNLKFDNLEEVKLYLAKKWEDSGYVHK